MITFKNRTNAVILILCSSLITQAFSSQKPMESVLKTQVDVWLASSMLQVRMDAKAPATSDENINWAAARGEYEHSQICLRSNKAVKGLRVELSELKGEGLIPASNLSWRQVAYVNCPNIPDDYVYKYEAEPGWWPDPLLEVEKFNLEPDTTQPIWLTVYVPEGTKPGHYQGSAKVVSDEGTLAEVDIWLQVWPLDLPNPGKVDTAFSFYYTYPGSKDDGEFDFMDKIYGKFTPEIRDRYFDFLAKHRIHADMLYLKKHPRPIEDYERNIKGGAQSLNIYYVSKDVTDANEVVKIVEPVAEHFKRKGLLKYFYVYGFDEKGKKAIPTIRKVYGAIKKRWPELRTMLVPQGWAPEPNMPIDIYVCNFNREMPEARDRWLAAGKEYWWYHACTPYKLNTFIEWPAVNVRLLMWMAADNNISGYLYYCGNLWSYKGPTRKIVEIIGPGPRTDFNPATFRHSNGDGNFYYPGPKGPLSSVRLENLTDALEDWEMFIQLREKAKASGEKGIAHKLIQKLIRNKEDFTQDPKLLEATRREAAKMLIYINEKMKTQR